MILGQAPPLSGLGSGQGLRSIPSAAASHCGRSDQMKRPNGPQTRGGKQTPAFFFSMYIFCRFFFFFCKMSQFFHNL